MVDLCCVLCSDSYPFAEILKGTGTGLEMYRQMAAILDGDLASSTQEFAIQLDDFNVMRKRLIRVQQRCIELGRLAANVCKLCTIIQHVTVCHGGGGCPRAYLMCYKCCIGRHPSKDCRADLFKVPSQFCWKCWMPLKPILGYSFHSDHPHEIGSSCSSPARDVLKIFCILFYHNRALAPMVTCPATSQAQFVIWLFGNSAPSAAGEANVPNVLALFDAAYEQ